MRGVLFWVLGLRFAGYWFGLSGLWVWGCRVPFWVFRPGFLGLQGLQDIP